MRDFELVDETKAQRRSLRVAWVIVLMCICAFSGQLFSQQLFIKPICGKPGSTVSITGSGWAEPEPVCHYNFLFDGAAFAPPQPDGLFGPPNRTTTIPANASVGDHKIRVELRIDSNNELRQCVEDTFRVVAATSDPFDSGKNVKPGGKPQYGPGNIVIDFDPTGACAVSKCTALRAIQAIQQTGKKADGTIRDLTYTEQNTPGNDADICSLATGCAAASAGWTIDTATPQPYYSPPGAGHSGEQSTTPKVSELTDRPGRDATGFPSDI